MKAILIQLTIIASLICTLAGCSSDGELKNLGVTAVTQLYEPDNGKAVILQSSASATVYFEWEPARAEDSGMVLYEIAFDKASGDFSNPVYTMPSDNNGGVSHATITHKQMNQIAAMMGLGSSETGTFKWTVISSKGINPVKATQERTITVTRLAGFADVPVNVYITGEATEVGDDLTKAIKMKSTADGEFEIYTKLTANKSYHFVDGTSGTPRTFYTADALIYEGNISSIVPTTGIYKITLDFNTKIAVRTEILKVTLFINAPQVEIELLYTGLGIWNLQNYTISDVSDTDDRYKFRMVSATEQSEWRAVNNDSKPSGNNPAYYYMVQKFDVAQWTNNQIWKSPATDGWNHTFDFMFSLNPGETYTHNLVIK